MFSTRCGRLALFWLPVLRCRLSLAMTLLVLLGLIATPPLFRSPAGVPAPFRLPGMPLGLAVDAASHRVVLTTVANDAMLTLDGPSATLLGDAIFPDGYGTAAAVDSSFGRVYVASTQSRLVVLASPIPTPVATINLDQIPVALAINPTTARVYVATRNPRRDAGPDDLVVLDSAREAILAEVPIGQGPLRVAADSATDRVYVADDDTDTLTVVDGTSMAPLGTLPLGRGPHELAVNARTGRVYVSNGEDHSLSVLDGPRAEVLATVPVAGTPGAVAVNERLDRVYVVTDAGAVARLDGASNRPLATVPVGQQPAGLAVDAALGRVYVTDPIDGTVWLIQDSRVGPPRVHLIADGYRSGTSPGLGRDTCGC